MTLLVPTRGFWGQSPLVGKIHFDHLTGAYVDKYKLRGIKIVRVTQIIRDVYEDISTSPTSCIYNVRILTGEVIR